MEPNKAIKKVVDEMLGYFGLEERARKPLTAFANILVGIGFDSGRRHASNRGKPVLQMDMDGNIIGSYSTMKEAANAVHIDKRRVSDVCNEIKKSAGGFKWKFLNPDDYYRYKQVK